jgi:hypothetical protein
LLVDVAVSASKSENEKRWEMSGRLAILIVECNQTKKW